MKITGNADVRTVVIDGKLLDLKPSQAVWNHSPDGFNWGYGGSGPAQLALAILLFVGVRRRAAVRLHQQLKWDLVAKLPQGQSFEIDFDIEAWLTQHRDDD